MPRPFFTRRICLREANSFFVRVAFVDVILYQMGAKEKLASCEQIWLVENGLFSGPKVSSIFRNCSWLGLKMYINLRSKFLSTKTYYSTILEIILFLIFGNPFLYCVSFVAAILVPCSICTTSQREILPTAFHHEPETRYLQYA